MKVLILSTDKSIFNAGSVSHQRMRDYGDLAEEIHIVIYTAKNENRKPKNIAVNIFLHPTDTWLKPLYFFGAYRIAKKIIVNCKLKIENSVVTAQDPFETGLVGYLVKKRFKLPLQIQIHTDFLSPYFWRESFKNKIRVILGKWLVKKADGLRVVSDRIKKSLVALGRTPTPIDILPIFVDAEKIKSAPVRTDLHQKYPGRFIILMASRLTREKNIGLAIEAIKNLASDHPNILLLIVGSGPEHEALKSQITNHKLQNNVVIESWYDDLPSYYKTADLFLLTSNYEGYCRTVVEATAAGLPVLMTDVGVVAGFIVPVGDKKSLAEKLDLLISDQLEREKSLEDQEKVLDFYVSKEDYLNQLKQSWGNCFS